MKEKFISKVPERLNIQPAVVSARTAWNARYNVALWFRLHQLCTGDARLVLKYMDQEGISRRVLVDQSSTDLTHQILLSGEVTLTAVGNVIDMSVYLEMPDNPPGYTVEELFVQGSDRTHSVSAKLITAA